MDSVLVAENKSVLDLSSSVEGKTEVSKVRERGLEMLSRKGEEALPVEAGLGVRRVLRADAGVSVVGFMAGFSEVGFMAKAVEVGFMAGVSEVGLRVFFCVLAVCVLAGSA